MFNLERAKMNRTVAFHIVWVCIISTAGFGGMTDVFYEVTDLGAGRWEYTYEVVNHNLSIDGDPAAVLEFTIWFDSHLYDNIAVTSGSLLSDWDQIVWQPEPAFGDSGAYDALAFGANLGILPGARVEGFSITFDWLAAGTPGAQPYQIINPATFQTLDSGLTVPEPTTMGLLAIGALALVRKRRQKN